MPYAIELNSAGRYVVTNPKGKTWKTTYPSQEAAEKATAYIEGRFSAPGTQESAPEPASGADSPDTSVERKLLGIPPLQGETDDTEGW